MAGDRVVLTGRVRAGKLKVRRWPGFGTWRDSEVLITVERAKATRSLQQNAYYWGVVLAHLSDHTGYTVDELHAYCKLRFNPIRLAFCDADGVVTDDARIPGSTAKLNTIAFGEYVEAIRQWAAEDLHVAIPDPQEVAA